MSRAVLVALVGALALPAPAAARGFSLGVASGEVTATSAVLWTRADGLRTVTVEVSANRRFREAVRRGSARVRASDDFTVSVRVPRLRPATTYWYRFRSGRFASPLGRFSTAPAPATNAVVRFGVTGDADATRSPQTGRPAFNTFGIYARMADEGNDFNINLGDTIYSDSEVAGIAPALTVRQKWAKYRLNWAMPAHARLRAATGLYEHWDDHEFVNDFTRAEDGEAVYRAGVTAFRDYAPVPYSRDLGIYRTFRWGKNVELFLLDERSFRSAKASSLPSCRTASDVPDLAPTAPQPVRNAFAALAPALAQPVASECLGFIGDPDRTMLGVAQLERFMADVRRSTATFKVIVNEVPIQQFYALPYDRWEGYAAERRRVLEFLRQNVPNAVFLTTDTHANLAGDVRLQTLETGGPVESGILEVVTGPVATNTFAKEIDDVLGSPGSGSLITALFFKPPPPSGVGFRCAATDVYSYAEVRVTASSLTVTPRDVNGELVREAGGAPCGPFTVRARAR